MKEFKFNLFKLGFITGLFKSEDFLSAIRNGTTGGFKLLRREFTIERRRILFFLSALSFGMIFEKDDCQAQPNYEWDIAQYNTRFFSKTIDKNLVTEKLNSLAATGYELHFAFKYPSRFLFIFPREAYFFLFRRSLSSTKGNLKYSIGLTPYRFFSRTINDELYTTDLNMHGKSKTLKATFRDEKRVCGLFRQPAVFSIWEE